MKDLLVQIACWLEKTTTIGSPVASILLYHSISSSDTVVDVTRQAFAKQLEVLSASHRFVSVDEVVDYIDEKKLFFGQPVVALTFDDGYTNLLKLTPLIKKYNLRPLVFITAQPAQINREELANNHKVMDEAQVKKLIAAGWDIGCHTLTHPNLLTLSEEQLQEEISNSKAILESTYGVPVNYFAYPKGYYNKKIVDIVRNAGYHAAFTTERGLISHRTSRFTIYRIGIDRTLSQVSFPFMLTYSALLYFGVKQSAQSFVTAASSLLSTRIFHRLKPPVRISP